MANGLLGDDSPVGEGVSELRIQYGPGYRVYLQQRDDDFVLLCGGDKSSEIRDIGTANKLASEWR
ncbi:type II toxin-antitoxin system RelE/ParE family toxin [Pseudomonas arsenicoxydans]|uniref:Type II toxin-antitoxin system RelE/ParE family toxin n=1 Tax=Pseudomonas arsenicoxydans TaxID=702115 RepID=A0A502GU01_9PSED|nr:type II toxin-antitoxin system RelE/ParE family toxin [Pseudomonas arsenicoxydans]